jgi:hypothetical protein
MKYEDVVNKVFHYFSNEHRKTITLNDIANMIGVEKRVASKKYVRKMIKEGLLDVGISYLLRNDNVFRLLHGYQVNIVKETGKGKIELTDWLNYANRDNEMRLDGFAEATNPLGEHVKIENEGITLWLAHPENWSVWFDYRDGKIIVKNPDQESRMKMIDIAKKLGAVVKGEDGEYYGDDGLRVIE